MARKREEKSARNAHRAAQKARAVAAANDTQDGTFVSLKQQLAAMGLMLREIPGDGNCLFGALADQLDGSSRTHQKHRRDVVSYMRQHRSDFEPFVEDDIPFERHLSNLAELGTYGGNECIVAFARLHKVTVVIHQLNTPLWQISDAEGKEGVRELHISYHNGDHYNSVRRIDDYSSNPPNIKLFVQESAVNGKEEKKGSSEAPEKYFTQDYRHTYEKGFACSEENCESSESSDSVSDVEYYLQHVVDVTGCDDYSMIRCCLEENEYDVLATTHAVSNYIALQHKGDTPHTAGIWSAGGTGTRILGQDAAEAATSSYHQPKKHTAESLQAKLKNQPYLSNARRKELKRQIWKQKANERKRNQGASCSDEAGAAVGGFSTEDAEVIIVKDIGCLSI